MGFWSQCVYRVKKRVFEAKVFLNSEPGFWSQCTIWKRKKDISRARNRLLGTMLLLSQKRGFGGNAQIKKGENVVSWARNGLLEPTRFSSQKRVFWRLAFLKSSLKMCFGANKFFESETASLEQMHRLQKEKMIFYETETGFYNQSASRVKNELWSQYIFRVRYRLL